MDLRPETDGTAAVPELPTLEPGVTLLDAPDKSTALHALAVDQLLLEGGTATWVGTGRHCGTDTLRSVAPDRRVLDRVELARGFTPYQHTALVNQLPEQVSEETAVVVVPDIDARYRGDDVQGGDGQELLVRALARLAAVAREHDLPVLCTRTADDAFAAPVDAAAETTYEVRETSLGPRFVGDGFETLVYPAGDGWVQTTLAFWQRVLQARQPLHEAAPAGPEVTVRGTN
jgi:hypothetical protein